MGPQGLLHARDDLGETTIHHQVVAELPGEDGFQEDAPGFLGLARVVRIEGFEALLDFRLEHGERRTAARAGWSRHRKRLAARLQSRGAFGHLLSDDPHDLVEAVDGVHGGLNGRSRQSVAVSSRFRS